MQKSKIITNPRLKAIALEMEQDEINEYAVYTALAQQAKKQHNKEVLSQIALAELGHAQFWAERTGIVLTPQKGKVLWTVMTAKILGLQFILKLMEKNEGTAAANYELLMRKIPEVVKISADETQHEMELVEMISEEKLHFMGAIVLGLNDALVELVGVLAGFTLAMPDAKMVSLAGLITGISAALSMGSAEYLSRRADNDRRALKAGIYTLGAYLATVIILIAPFLMSSSSGVALVWTIVLAVGIIAAFNYYLSVVKNTSFKKRFKEMALLSGAVAVVSFIVGWILEKIF